ncbi:MAG: CHAP domain-containing protein [Nanoarchaeota archaeon]
MGLIIAATVIFVKNAKAFSINDITTNSWNFFNLSWLSNPEVNSNPIIEPIIVKIPNVKDIGPTKNKIFLPGDDNIKVAGQCVNYIKYVTGVEYSGNASGWVSYINSGSPTKYSIAVISAGRWGHIGLVIDDDYSDGKVTVRSRNWRGLWTISDDEFDIKDVRIVGYIKY